LELSKAAEKPASAVERAIALLSHIATQAGEANLTELSESQGLSRSVAYKLLQTLVAEGLVEHDPKRKTYRAGLGLYNLATAILHRTSFMQLARANMRALVQCTGESACLNLLDATGSAFTVAAVEESPAPLQYVIPLGRRHPLHAGASGKAILAFQPDETLKRVLGRKLEAVTDGTVVDPVLLREQLAKVRRAGYAVSMGERLVGAVGIAAPIFGHSEHAVGSVQLTIPKHRFKQALVAQFAPAVTEAAALISGVAQALPTDG
jgi:DNA-binding IclR family transcriptional regulator